MSKKTTVALVSIAILIGFGIGYTVALYKHAPYACRLDGNPYTCDDIKILEIPVNGAGN